MIPRVIVGLAGVIGIFGFGSYLNSGTLRPATDDSPKQLRRFVDQNEPAARKLEDLKGHSSTVDRSPQLASVVEPTQKPPDEVVAAKVPSQKVVTVEQGYTCGAETKKGSPCSRGVKRNVRCFQHPGMPAMVTAEKLRIN